MMQKPPHKKQKLPSTRKIFQNVDDEKQYLQIASILNDLINDNNNKNNKNIYPTIPNTIINEISEYATGNIIECIGKCSGWIHFLYGDNFDDKSSKCIDNWNCWNLCKYQCDDCKCQKIFNVLWCNDKYCHSTKIIIDGISPYPHYVCENAQKLKPTCCKMFCDKHFINGGVQCEFCQVYYCTKCSKHHGKYCNKCDKYWCDDDVQDCDYFNVKCVLSSETHEIEY